MGYGSFTWDEFVLNSEIYKINLQYLKLNALVNSAINIDINQRPTADDLLNIIS